MNDFQSSTKYNNDILLLGANGVTEKLLSGKNDIGDDITAPNSYINSLESLENPLNSVNNPIGGEKERFTRYSPLVTLLFFCIGPLSTVYQVTGETIDQFLVSYRYKDLPQENPMNLYGFANIIIQTYALIGAFFAQVCMCTIPKLIGQGEKSETTRFINDIYKFAFISSAIFPFGFFWIVKPFVTFEGCPEDQLQRVIYFIMPPTIGIIIIVFYNMTGGVLMGAGRADWAAFNRIIAYTLQVGVFTPLLLFGIKVSVGWIRSSMVWAELLTNILVLTLLFKGKLTVKPDFKQIFSTFRFAPGFFKTLILGAPVLIQLLCLALPPTFILQSLTTSMKEDANAIAAVFGVFNRLSVYVNTFPHTFIVAFLNVGTHSYGCKDYKRLLTYLGWTLLLAFLVIAALVAAILLFTREVASIFLHTERELAFSEVILRIPFYTVALQVFTHTFNFLLIIAGHPYLSLLSSAIQATLLAGGCNIFNVLFPENPFNVMYVYNVTDIVCFIVSLSFVSKPLYTIWKDMKKQEELNNNTTSFVSIKDDEYLQVQ